MLEAIQLSKRYGAHSALEDLNLRIGAGEIFCLLGSNGAGKTTTIQLFLNFISPSAGSALVNGLDVTTHSAETKQLLAYIPETVTLYPRLTGMENLAYFAALSGGAMAESGLRECLGRAGLPAHAIGRPVSEYSKGMRQKVAIAIAIAKQARALLLDEPTSGLDPKAANEFSSLLRQLSADGVAILMATHDLFRAKECGTRLGIMRRGRLVDTVTAASLGHTDLERLYLDYMHD